MFWHTNNTSWHRQFTGCPIGQVWWLVHLSEWRNNLSRTIGRLIFLTLTPMMMLWIDFFLSRYSIFIIFIFLIVSSSFQISIPASTRWAKNSFSFYLFTNVSFLCRVPKHCSPWRPLSGQNQLICGVFKATVNAIVGW